MEFSYYFIGILILTILLFINAGLSGELTPLITAVLLGIYIVLFGFTFWKLGLGVTIKYVIASIVLSMLFGSVIRSFWTK